MAWDFAEQIHAMTGFNADSTETTESGETFVVMGNRWLTDAAREIIDSLPPLLTERCSKVSSAFAPNSGVTTENKVLSVQRALDTNFKTGEIFSCRQIPHTMAHKAADVNSLEAATNTDPVFYYEPQTDTNAVKIKVLPASAASVAKTITIDYPAIENGYIVIDNFPDEAEYLVPMRASIYALEYLLAHEEDIELYLPMIQNLKQEYMQGLQALGAKVAQPQQAGG